MNTPKRTVAIYARVSTKDKQEALNQLRQLRVYAKKQKWTLSAEYVDKLSGTTDKRPQFQKLFVHAHQKKFDVVLFWSLDRFSREGVRETLNHLRKLEDANVDFVSYTEPYLNTLGQFRDAIIGILASLAQQEVSRHKERIHAGLERARAEGKRIGRPPLSDTQIKEIKKLRKTMSVRAVAEKMGLSVGVVGRYKN